MRQHGGGIHSLPCKIIVTAKPFHKGNFYYAGSL